MYGTSKSAQPFGKDRLHDTKERLQAVHELKQQYVTVNEELTKLNACQPEIEKRLNDCSELLTALETRIDQLEAKIELTVNEIFDSIENYIATATPRGLPDIDDIKQKLLNVEQKVNDLSKKDLSMTTEERPKTKLLRPVNK